MAKEIPYFRFTVQDWQNGKITLERFELQGLFINICGYYWINDCGITLAMLQKKFSNAIPMISELIELGIMKHEKRHDKLEIDFLNNQYDLLSEKRKRRQEAGSMGGNAKALLQQKGSYKDKDKDNNKDKNKKGFSAPVLEDVKQYFKENGYSESSAITAFNYYHIAEWKDSRGKQVKNWKQKMISVWFKEENKISQSEEWIRGAFGPVKVSKS